MKKIFSGIFLVCVLILWIKDVNSYQEFEYNIGGDTILTKSQFLSLYKQKGNCSNENYSIFNSLKFNLWLGQECGTRYPWCDSNDIEVWSWQIIASCNVWQTKSWNWIEQLPDCNWVSTNCYENNPLVWHYFQWWRNDILDNSFTDTTATSITNNLLWNSQFIRFPSIIPNSSYNWLNSNDRNLWWWELTSPNMPSSATYKVYSDLNEENKRLMQWPCADWYHIPTYFEVGNLFTYYFSWPNPKITEVNEFLRMIQLPYIWYRSPSWSFYSKSYGGIVKTVSFQTSTPIDLFVWYNANYNFITILNENNERLIQPIAKSYGIQIRCFKN